MPHRTTPPRAEQWHRIARVGAEDIVRRMGVFVSVLCPHGEQGGFGNYEVVGIGKHAALVSDGGNLGTVPKG